MIVSHKHRYLFIEIPLTACSAIHHELCRYYDGTPILHKHASFPEFQRMMGAGAANYLVFATVRNPLDKAVSHFMKIKHDYRGYYSNPAAAEELRVDYADLRKHEILKETEASFGDYLKRYQRRAYTESIELSRGKIDFIIRYERLQADFSDVLQQLDLARVRPLPVIKRTPGKRRDWQSYYDSPEVIAHARDVFGPFMKRWGYEFPEGWGDYCHSRARELEFKLMTFAAGRYLLHIRYSNRLYARALRWLRASVTVER